MKRVYAVEIIQIAIRPDKDRRGEVLLVPWGQHWVVRLKER